MLMYAPCCCMNWYSMPCMACNPWPVDSLCPACYERGTIRFKDNLSLISAFRCKVSTFLCTLPDPLEARHSSFNPIARFYQRFVCSHFPTRIHLFERLQSSPSLFRPTVNFAYNATKRGIRKVSLYPKSHYMYYS